MSLDRRSPIHLIFTFPLILFVLFILFAFIAARIVGVHGVLVAGIIFTFLLTIVWQYLKRLNG